MKICLEKGSTVLCEFIKTMDGVQTSQSATKASVTEEKFNAGFMPLRALPASYGHGHLFLIGPALYIKR